MPSDEVLSKITSGSSSIPIAGPAAAASSALNMHCVSRVTSWILRKRSVLRSTGQAEQVVAAYPGHNATQYDLYIPPVSADHLLRQWEILLRLSWPSFLLQERRSSPTLSMVNTHTYFSHFHPDLCQGIQFSMHRR